MTRAMSEPNAGSCQNTTDRCRKLKLPQFKPTDLFPLEDQLVPIRADFDISRSHELADHKFISRAVTRFHEVA